MLLRFARALAPVLALTLFCPLRGFAQSDWVGTWAAAPSAVASEQGALRQETTLREVVHISRGGTAVRVTVTNELGTEPLTVAGLHLGSRSDASTLLPGSDQPLTFAGQPSITIPPGAVALSDPLPRKVAPMTDLVITLLLPQQPMHTVTAHTLGLQTNFQANGDQLASASLTGAKPVGQWWFLKNVEVSAKGGGAVVAFGDSITDGYRSTPDTNRRWPDVLARRLQADKRLNRLSVLNEGISGNRVLHDVAGPNALARFDRDVLSQAGVRYLIILEGINDIGRTAQPRNPGDEITTQQLIAAYEQMIERAHAHGIKVFGATLTPFQGAGYATPAGETMRQAVNAWIRTPGHFDGLIDFDKVTRDAANPSVLSAAADSGDHLHPGDAGYQAMADSIDVSLFNR